MTFAGLDNFKAKQDSGQSNKLRSGEERQRTACDRACRIRYTYSFALLNSGFEILQAFLVLMLVF